jgi:DNA helicase-2/ATP-dependent DNA helicase PcrA
MLGSMGDPTADSLLDGLNESQRHAVTTDNLPLCILAGAGSGKTRVLTRRIAWRSVTGRSDPRRVLALTFTRKAAGELTARLRTLGLRDSVVAGTFHAVAYSQLRTRWAERDITPPTLLDRKVGFVARLIPRSAIERKDVNGATLPLDVVSEIEWAKARMINPSQYAARAETARRTPPVDGAVIADVYERYEIEKRKRRMIDFDDLLRLHARDLKADDDYGGAIRWRYQHLFVDEFQDVNPQQHALLAAWLGDRRDLCVVGDPNQAIYAWNGADARYINEFDRSFPGCEIVQLADNYRSSPQILAVANTVLGRAGRRPGAPDTPVLRANRPEGPIPDVSEYPDDVAEAQGVARAVRDTKQPRTAWSSQAVLVRTNAQTAVIEQALRQAGIPCRVRGQGGLLDQPEVKAVLRSIEHSSGRLEAVVRDLELELAEAPSAAAASGDDASGAAGGAGGAGGDERADNVDAVIRLAHDFLAVDPAATTTGFVAWLADTVRSDQPDRAGDAVDVVTFHAAKGLEWPVVHLAGIEQGLVPIGHAQTPPELAEERRLFYVAITRAERELHLSWAATRTFRSRVANRFPSPYLDDVAAACDALQQGADPADWAAALARQRADLRSRAESVAAKATRRTRAPDGAGDLDAAATVLFDALKTWRSETARSSSVPAYVVLDNKTLVAIAAARPASEAALSRISGIGPVKLTRYGSSVLEIVRAHSS